MKYKIKNHSVHFWLINGNNLSNYWNCTTVLNNSWKFV